MGTTPNRQYRYPGGGDAATIAQYFRNIAEDVDADMVARVAGGTVTVTPSAANTPTELPVSFGQTFAAVPVITLTVATGSPQNVAVSTKPSSKTTTGFTLVLTRTDTTPTSVTWLAVLP